MTRNVVAAVMALAITACAAPTTETLDAASVSLASAERADAEAVTPVVEISALPNEAAQDVVCIQETSPARGS